MSRLGKLLWLPILVLLLEVVVNAPYLHHVNGGVGADYTPYVFVRVLLKSLLPMASWAFIFWWICAIPRGRVCKRIVLSLCISLIVLVYLLESISFWGYGMVFDMGLLQLFMDTNATEAKGLWGPSLLQAVGISIAVASVVGLLVWLCSASKFRPSKQTILVGYFFSVGIVVASWVTWTSFFYDSVIQAWRTEYRMAPYDRLLWYLWDYQREVRLKEECQARMKALVKEVRVEQQWEPHTIVLIIGETLRRDYMHCYGYPLEDTPHLDSLLATGDLVAYSNVVSPAPTTIESLSKVLTFYTNEESSPWYSYLDLFSALSAGGYYIDWVSGQESRGVFSVSAFSDVADKRTFIQGYDEELLPLLKLKGQVGSDKPNFMEVVHLRGSYQKYSHQLPAGTDWRPFSSSSLPKHLGEDKDKEIADYVNTVYYNDYVVSEIIKHYAAEDAMVIYFSDHGEVIFDDPTRPNFCHHGLTPGGVSVPFFVYMSPAMQEKHPDVWATITQAKGRRIMNDLFTHSLTALLGIKTPYSNPKLEFWGGEYDESRRRIARDAQGNTLEL